jgi:hypothetical protein
MAMTLLLSIFGVTGAITASSILCRDKEAATKPDDFMSSTNFFK